METDIAKLMELGRQQNTFSNWMGAEILELRPGWVKLSVKIRQEMANGLGICHGGILFAIADTAAGLAANVHGTTAIGLQNSINYLKKVQIGDVVTAETEEVQNGRTIGVYKINLTNQKDELVAIFKGTVFKNRRDKEE